MDFNTNTRWAINKIWFYYRGIRYEGHGVLEWEPGNGFHIEAAVDAMTNPDDQDKVRHIRYISLPQDDDYCSLRMKLGSNSYAFTPHVHLGDWPLFHHPNWLSKTVSHVVFSSHSEWDKPKGYWHGTAWYKLTTSFLCPDVLTREVQLCDKQFSKTMHASGLRHEEDNGFRIIGLLHEDKETIEFHWKLPKPAWSRANAWQCGEAIELSLCMLTGQTVRLVERKAILDSTTRKEIQNRDKPESLEFLSFFLGNEPLDKEKFIMLTKFFLSQDPNIEVCKRIFKQQAEAIRQKSWQSTELLSSTILEASLRCIDNQPFIPGEDSWKIDQGIKNFRLKYFPDRRWKKVCKRASDTFRRLRHRNAHPDWLFSTNGSLSVEKQTEALDDLIFMSHFYGYMVLALAGAKDLEPKFPIPHLEWKPMITISSGKTQT